MKKEKILKKSRHSHLMETMTNGLIKSMDCLNDSLSVIVILYSSQKLKLQKSFIQINHNCYLIIFVQYSQILKKFYIRNPLQILNNYFIQKKSKIPLKLKYKKYQLIISKQKFVNQLYCLIVNFESQKGRKIKMIDNYKDSSPLQDSMMGISTKSRHHKKSIYKNIKQTQLHLKEIRKFEERNILPFSLKQQKQRFNTSKNFQQLNLTNDNNRFTQQKLKQSDMSQKLLNRFQSRNHIGFKNQQAISGEKMVNDRNLNDIGSRNQDNLLTQNQQNLKKQLFNNNDKNQSNDNLIMLQIHLTISKKKYTIKVSNRITSQQLQQVIENFLIENSISNPAKKSHLKTKRSIIEMVENKIKDGNSTQYKQLGKSKDNEKIINKNKMTNQNQNQQNRQINFQEKKIQENVCQKKSLITPPQQKHTKFQRPFIQQKKYSNFVTQKDSINYEQKSQEQEQACSPSFKSSAYVNHKSPLKKTSRFSLEPKHQTNKYEKIVANYYIQNAGNNKIKQNQNQKIGQRWVNNKSNASNKQQKQSQFYSQNENESHSQSLKEKNKYFQNQQNQNNSSLEVQQQKAKSVYEKWKQRQKSKQINGKSNERQNFTNALKQRKQQTQNSFATQLSEQKKLERKQKNWNNNKINKGTQKPNFSINTHQIKEIDRRIPSRSPVNNKKIEKENLNMNKSTQSINKSPLHHQRNKTMIDEDYSPDRNMNRTQIIGSRRDGDSEVFETNKYIRGVKETTQRALTPTKTRMSTVQPKTPTNNQNQSKVYTIYDQDQYPIHQMSPDHFYKQGLVFEAKKKQQLQGKFKSLYPFTTRNLKDSNEISQGGSRNATIRNAKENSSVSDKSKDKYFSSKLSMHKNNVTAKSSVNIVLDQKEKSALHERLYQQNKSKQTKITATEATQRLIKIAKAPQDQNQIKIMQENLKNIKGLSQQKKVKLIERNIKIKQKIKQKDRMIDEQLQKMIKQGKVKPTCQIVQVRKSPFRKTKVF